MPEGECNSDKCTLNPLCEIPQTGIAPIIQTEGPIEIQYFETGGDVTLSCPFVERSSQAPSFSILKNGVRVDLFQYFLRIKNTATFLNDKKIILKSGSKNDEGIYQCRVGNKFGFVQSYNLSVQMAYIEDIPSPEVEKLNFNTDSPNSKEITCNITSNPVAEITWKKLNALDEREIITDKNIIISNKGLKIVFYLKS